MARYSIPLERGPHGLMARVKVGLSRPRARMRSLDGLLVPEPIEVLALVDTGATICAIDETIVKRLELVRAGVVSVAGVFSAPATPYVYDISVGMIGVDGWSPEPSPLIKAAGALLHELGYAMILGQSVLFACDIHMFGSYATIVP